MKRLLIALVLMFAGCAAKSAVLQPAAVPFLPSTQRPAKTIEGPPPPPALPPQQSAQQVALRYREIEEKIVSAVTSRNVTPEYIRNVQKADVAARRKLAALETKHGRLSRKAIEEARFAVGHLGEVLAEPPDQVDQP